MSHTHVAGRLRIARRLLLCTRSWLSDSGRYKPYARESIGGYWLARSKGGTW
jgi:hypothetical protein